VPKIVVIKNVICRPEEQQPKECGGQNPKDCKGQKPKNCTQKDCKRGNYGGPSCSNNVDCSSVPCGEYDGQTSASAIVIDANCPAFCYRIIVANAGTCPLTNVVVVDPLFGGPLAGYPCTLAPGASATNFYSTALCSNTVNTVVASGVSGSTNVTSTASASVKLLNASVTCSKLVSTDGVNFAESVNVPQDGAAHTVIYQLTVQNTSDSGVVLTNINIQDVNGCFSTCALPSSLSAGGSFTVLCTNLQNCTALCTPPPPCQQKDKKDKKGKQDNGGSNCNNNGGNNGGGNCNNGNTSSTSFTDTVVVVAEAVSQDGTACHHKKVTSTCSAVVNCVPPPCTPAISVIKDVVCRTGATGNGGPSCGSWSCGHVYSGSSSCQQGTDCSSLPGWVYDGSTSVTAINEGPGQCPDFCYRIIVVNSGTCPLTGVSVVDPLFGGALAGYPTSLAPGASATNFYTKSLCASTVNTVVASGTSSSGAGVSATNSASVTIVNASVSCSKLASTDGVNFAESVTIPADGSSHTVIYKLTVSNTSDSGVVLSNINITDVNGCLSTCKLPKTLASGGSFTVLCTNSQNCTSQGCTYGSGISNSSTNLVTVTAQASPASGSACGQTTVSSTCWAVVNCVPPPCTPAISVTKNVICRTGATGNGGPSCGSWSCSHVYSGSSSCQQGTDCSSVPGWEYDGSTSATAINLGAGQCPDFCYRIIVRNSGTCPLTGVSVVDPLFGGTLAGFPTSLAPGASATNFYTKSLCVSTVNTVVASGSSSGAGVSATNSASVTIVNASVSCSKLASTDGVNFASSVTIPADGSSHTVIYKLTVSNTSDSGVVLSNINVTDVNGCLSTCSLPKTLASGASFTVLCTNSQNCTSQGCYPGSSISTSSSTNLVTVTAQATSASGAACGQTTVSSTCWAVVNCAAPPCTPKIGLRKEIVCSSSGTYNTTKINCSTLPGSSFDGHTSCSGSKPSSNCSQSQCPQFCFRIIVTNTGTCPLTGVVVTDPLLGGTLSGYPSSLAPGASATNFVYDTLSACTTNIAYASGTSGGTSVSASASAVANVH
jgi:hypothetical protein